MNTKQFNTMMEARIKKIREINKELLNNGERNLYRDNCLELKGISFVLLHLKHLDIYADSNS